MDYIAEPLRSLAVPIAELHEDPSNARKGHAVERIAASLKQYGQRKPIVVNRAQGGKVEAGNGTLAAAKSLGWTHIAAVYVDDDAATAAAYGIADNRVGEFSEWDADILGDLMPTLDGLFTGFLPAELDAILPQQHTEGDTEPQIDRAEELRQKWGVESGQMWRLGEHRIICGDCTDAAVVERVMGGEKATVVIADPPYGISIVAANGYVGGGEGPNGMIPFGGKKGKGFGSIGASKPFGSKDIRGSIGASNIVSVGKYAPIIGDETTDTAVKASAFYLAAYPKAAQFWWGGNYYADHLPASSCWVVWDKETTGNFADCELAWSNQDKAARILRHQWNGMLRASERERRWHPSQKPAALASFLILEFGEGGDIVLDPFAGAGWVLIAGEQTGAKVRAIEMSVDYVAVAIERWATATGGTPELLP